jgi:hypothetical protein
VVVQMGGIVSRDTGSNRALRTGRFPTNDERLMVSRESVLGKQSFNGCSQRVC